MEETRAAAAAAEEANEKLGVAEMNVHRAEGELARFHRDLESIAREIERANDGGDHDTVQRLETHQGEGFAARDNKTKQIDWLRGERDAAASAARDATREVQTRSNEGKGKVSHVRSRVEELQREMLDRKARLEEIRSGCAENAAAHDEAARRPFAPRRRASSRREEAATPPPLPSSGCACRRMPAQAAYDAAADRERHLRDELSKAEDDERDRGASRPSGPGDDVRGRLEDAKRTAEWAAGLEEQRRAKEREVAEAEERLRQAEDRARETMSAGDHAFRVSEELEQTRRAAAMATAMEEERRAAAIAAVDASHKLRVAQERVDEMTSKMRKKEHEFADAERAIEDATREAEAAKRESVEAKETERRLAERVGGGGGGGGGDDERSARSARRSSSARTS